MHRPQIAIATLLLLATVLQTQGNASAVEMAKVTPCSVSVKSCGCTIVAPGFYDVSGTLLDIILNPDTSCIAVKSPNVFLSLEGVTISGAGAGLGIHLLSTAKNSFVQGAPGSSISMISGWTVGIQDEATDSVIENVATVQNSSAGIVVQKAEFVRLNEITSTGNTSGIWLDSSSFGQVSDSPSISNNTGSGILVGCGANCSSPASNSNRIFDNQLSGNHNGIVIADGSRENFVTNNSVSTSKQDDLEDLNNDCATNLWFDDTFTTAEPETCVH